MNTPRFARIFWNALGTKAHNEDHKNGKAPTEWEEKHMKLRTPHNKQKSGKITERIKTDESKTTQSDENYFYGLFLLLAWVLVFSRLSLLCTVCVHICPENRNLNIPHNYNNLDTPPSPRRNEQQQKHNNYVHERGKKKIYNYFHIYHALTNLKQKTYV